MHNYRNKKSDNECGKIASILMSKKTSKVQENIPYIQNNKTHCSNRDLSEDDRTYTAEKDKRHHNRRDIR